MQWVGISPVPSPSSMAATDRNRGFYSNQGSYFTESAGVYGYLAQDLWASCYDLNSFRSKLREVFNQGGAVTLHVAGPNSWAYDGYSGGHYCLGIGISNDGSKVHIVDSSSGTTLGIVRNSSYNAYYYNGSSFVALNKNWGIYDTIHTVSGGKKTAYASGCEYWVDIGFIQINQEYYYNGNRASSGWTVGIKKGSGSASYIQLWGIDENSVWNGNAKFWAKRSDNDSNHYAVMYIDDIPVTGHLSSDASGFFSAEIDTTKYADGTHKLSIYYANTAAGSWDTRQIVFNNGIEVCKIQLWGIDEDSEWNGIVKFWAKRFDFDLNHYAIFYIDDVPFTGHMSSDNAGFFSAVVDTTKYADGNHQLSIYYANTAAGDWDVRQIELKNIIRLQNVENNSALCRLSPQRASRAIIPGQRETQ